MTKLGGLRVDFEGDSKDLEVAARRSKEALAGVGRQAEATAGRQAKANKQSKALAGSFGKLSTMSGQARNSIRNTTFQLQDIAVQLQMGTRMSTVMSQQLPQLGMGFGAVGLAAGTLAGIAAGVIGALSNLRGESKSLTENMDSLTEAIGRYNKASELATTTNAELIEKFGGINTEFRNLLGVLADVEASNALANFDTAMNSVVESTSDMLSGLVEYGQMLKIAEGNEMQTAVAAGFLRDSIEQFGKSVGLTELQVSKLLTPLRKLTEAEGPTEARIAVEEFFRAAEDAGVEVDKLDKNGRKFFVTLGEIATAAALIEPPLTDAAVTVDLLNEGLGIGKTRLQEMSDEAAALAERLGVSANAAAAIMGMQGGGRGGDPREAESALLRGMGGEFIARPEAKGAKRRSTLEADLERLQKNLATEMEIAQTSFDNQAEVLQSALDERLITQQEFEELSLRSKKDYTDAMANLDKTGFQAQVGYASDFFGTLSGLMSSENKRLFEIGKAGAIGTALINTYKGISESLAKYPMPWAGAMAAAHAAVGFANVAKIKSTTFGGGGGGGGAGAVSTPAAPAGGGGASTLVNVSLQGDNFSASGVRGLLDQINDVIEDGGRIRLV